MLGALSLVKICILTFHALNDIFNALTVIIFSALLSINIASVSANGVHQPVIYPIYLSVGLSVCLYVYPESVLWQNS